MRPGRADAGERFLVGGTENVEDLVQLVDIVATLKEWSSTEQLGENAADRPHVDSLGVALEAQHNFWCTVPPRSHVFRHVSSVLLGVNGETTRETEIANLELAVGVDEEVTGLQVAVKDIGGVDVLETAEDLVDERLEVCVGQRLARSDDGGKIALHELFVKVGLVEVVGAGDIHVVEACDVAMTAEVLQQLDLAQSALGEDLFAEDICNLLDSNTLTGLVVDGSAGGNRQQMYHGGVSFGGALAGLPDNSIGALTKLLGHSVALVDDEVLVEDLEDLAPGEIGHLVVWRLVCA